MAQVMHPSFVETVGGGRKPRSPGCRGVVEGSSRGAGINPSTGNRPSRVREAHFTAGVEGFEGSLPLLTREEKT